jgi:hypothetical protein
MRLLATLEKDTANFTIEWEKETIGFSAKRNALTPRLMKRFTDIEKDPMQMAYALASIITKWDIEDVDPTDAESLADLPVEFLTKIVEKLGEVWSGNPQKAEASASGSAV